MEKQQKILQMAKDICRYQPCCNDVCNPISACDALKYAERAVEAGYVKQSEGEWIEKKHISTSKTRGRTIHYATYKCSVCGKWNGRKKQAFCPDCGARMRGSKNE